MAKDPAFLLYSQDFLIGCAEMSNEEIGQYFRILLYEHQKGRLTEETIRLLVGSISISVKNKFNVDDCGYWYNQRLESEIEKRQNFVNSRKNNGNLGGRPKKEKPNENLTITDRLANENLSENENENEDEDINKSKIKKVKVKNTKIDFDEFWEKYDKKVGKEKAIKKWDNLNLVDQQKAMAHIPLYKISTPDKQYRKNPETYLNNKSWNDEIIINGTNGHNGNPITYDELLASMKGLSPEDTKVAMSKYKFNGDKWELK